MRKKITFFASLLFLVLCSFSNAAEDADIKKFAMAFIAAEKLAWENGELDNLLALEHQDVLFQNINGTVFQGWDAHKQTILETREGWMGAEIQTEWQYLMGDGNMFAIAYTWTIHIAEQPLIIRGIAVGRLENGKLKEEWGAGSLISAPGN